MAHVADTVVVSHPARQHSHQTALGLFDAGMLHSYWTGIPCLPEHGRALPAWLRRRLIQQSTIPLPPQKVTWNPVAPALRRAMTAMLGQRGSRWSLYAGYWLFDRWAAAKLRRAGARAVICYENA